MKSGHQDGKTEPALQATVWDFGLGHPLRLDRGEDRGEVSNSGNQKTATRRGNEFWASLFNVPETQNIIADEANITLIPRNSELLGQLIAATQAPKAAGTL